MKHTLRSTIVLGTMLCLCSFAVAQEKTKAQSLQEFLDALNGIVHKAVVEKERQEDRSARANAMLNADEVVLVVPEPGNSSGGVSRIEVIDAFATVNLRILTLEKRVASLEQDNAVHLKLAEEMIDFLLALQERIKMLESSK